MKEIKVNNLDELLAEVKKHLKFKRERESRPWHISPKSQRKLQ
ncbi:hypothetical protein [endosymbiont GvMRE of Glomus versiforme]|nr:hypothetical protein [endosymbiont GvMRE of Glomus versiforme]RHZ36441.1 hypothetical protein GvMRE_Ic1g182 [endosymbiont GvMRE of Glomus versiforme]